MKRPILLSHDGAVSTVELNQLPENFITRELLDQLNDAIDVAEDRDTTRCLVITSSSADVFSAGGGLTQIDQQTVAEARAFREAGRDVLHRLETFPKPVNSAVRGRCAASGEALAWVCDIRIASESAVFNAGDVYGGTSPSWSMGMVRLVHYIGRNRTLDVMLLGYDLTAEEAYRLGLVTCVVADDQFGDEVKRLSNRLAMAAPLAVRALKKCVHAQWRDTPDRAAILEEKAIQRILRSNDAQEGYLATVEGRSPRFEGR